MISDKRSRVIMRVTSSYSSGTLDIHIIVFVAQLDGPVLVRLITESNTKAREASRWHAMGDALEAPSNPRIDYRATPFATWAIGPAPSSRRSRFQRLCLSITSTNHPKDESSIT